MTERLKEKNVKIEPTLNSFPKLWRLHSRWVLTKEIKKLKTADVYLGWTRDEYFNFALPTVSDPVELDLAEINRALSPIHKKASVYLWEKHLRLGFSEFLVRKGYRLGSRDTWLVLNEKLSEPASGGIKVKRLGLSDFEDYRTVLNTCFKDWPGEEEYNQLCFDSLVGKKKGKFKDEVSEFFVIYEGNKPIAGAGLLLSESRKIAYLHNDGTLPEYRGKGCQRALIEERVRHCLERGIEIFYSIVEHGEQSWRNYINLGFEQEQVANIFFLKER